MTKRCPRLTDKMLDAAIEAACFRNAGDVDDLTDDEQQALADGEQRLKEIRAWRRARSAARSPDRRTEP